MAVNYNAFIALLTAAMQVQQAKIDSLTTLTSKQDSINKVLQNQIDQITNTCCPKTGQRTTENTGDGKNTPLNGGVIGTEAKLFQNNPNPFSQTTSIKCFIPEQSKSASLLIFDLTGALKKTISINGKGEVNVTINAREFIAGMYNYTLLIDGQEIDTKKMILTEQ